VATVSRPPSCDPCPGGERCAGIKLPSVPQLNYIARLLLVNLRNVKLGLMRVANIKDRVMRWSRERKLSHFYSLRKEGESVLDVGIARNDWSDQVNVFLKRFCDTTALYTGLAVEDITEIALQNPGKTFCRYDGSVFPFRDGAFDWVFSNAVIEHVGGRESQLLFLREMRRVSRHVFFTTPNKYFPVESHTNVMFRHWSSAGFYQWCRENNPLWNEDNLYLMSGSYLRQLLDEADVGPYSMSSNRILGWPMTYTVVLGQV
jgi:hypothetical protein